VWQSSSNNKPVFLTDNGYIDPRHEFSGKHGSRTPNTTAANDYQIFTILHDLSPFFFFVLTKIWISHYSGKQGIYQYDFGIKE
jgi:hypothetical protein